MCQFPSYTDKITVVYSKVVAASSTESKLGQGKEYIIRNHSIQIEALLLQYNTSLDYYEDKYSFFKGRLCGSHGNIILRYDPLFFLYCFPVMSRFSFFRSNLRQNPKLDAQNQLDLSPLVTVIFHPSSIYSRVSNHFLKNSLQSCMVSSYFSQLHGFRQRLK